MDSLKTPILDNHLHLDPEHGQGIDAVKDFTQMGGTHLLVVNKPSWHLGINPTSGSDFDAVFETTIDIVETASEILPGRAWPVLGVHPGLISRLVDERSYDPETAAELMCAGLDRAASYVQNDTALALKSGRPHYDVSESVWKASNRVMKHAFRLGGEVDCAVQLHTEATDDLTDIAMWAEDRGVPAQRVVKHYAGGTLAGPTPSVMSQKDRLETAAIEDEPFLMETDFIDDPDRPGAVLGPKTVPRRVRWLQQNGYETAIEQAHIETPKMIYEIDTESTLASNS
ncbi:TatD family hydrolase [Haloquadratum walsbyi]|jgi:TatD-related deoxyribonuclease|uniref:TatD family hydrolase n=1 Tax=Haloquadratum walsbyi TaxID=293091 RepID=UPI0023F34D79|nr:TatD family hydrolase [Haloquadratum walsbyi]